jgi:hypothetical protein
MRHLNQIHDEGREKHKYHHKNFFALEV